MSCVLFLCVVCCVLCVVVVWCVLCVVVVVFDAYGVKRLCQRNTTGHCGLQIGTP